MSNTRCNANPTSTGLYSCNGLVGVYLIFGDPAPSGSDWINVGQLRAYSYKLNGYPDYTWNYFPNSLLCGTADNTTIFKNIRLDDSTTCYAYPDPTGSNVTWQEVAFVTQRYIHSVTIVGSGYAFYEGSKDWSLYVGNNTGGTSNLN